jgi:hypothetical protein
VQQQVALLQQQRRQLLLLLVLPAVILNLREDLLADLFNQLIA